MMYSKLFSSLVHSSLWSEPDHIRLLFITLLAIADRDGIVYGSRNGLERAAMIDPAASEEINPWEALMSPDKDSSDLMRNPENEGRRIEEIPGGFRIINYGYYKSLRDSEDRKQQNREAQRKHREKVSPRKPLSATVSHGKPIESKIETETDNKKIAQPASESEWIEELSNDTAYLGVDVSHEHAKALRWAKEKGVQMTRRRFTNWLNRADRNLNGTGKRHTSHNPRTAGTSLEGASRQYAGVGKVSGLPNAERSAT